jgi:hypothetical protein
MRIEVIGYWDDIAESANITRGRISHKNFDADVFEKWLISEHSPIRSVEIAVIITADRNVIMQLVRHTHAKHFVQSSRPDITGKPRDDEQKLYKIQANLQEWLHIARARLCTTTELETRKTLLAIIEAFRRHDPYLATLASYMVPKCAHSGRCTEPFSPCGAYPLKKLVDGVWIQV